MKTKNFLLSVLVGTLFCFSAITATAEPEIEKILLQDGDTSYAYIDGDTIYVKPEVLEDGGKWEIRKKDGRYFVTMKNLGNETFSLPTEKVKNEEVVNLHGFGKAAGLRWEYRGRVHNGHIHESEKIEKEDNVIIMWDPDCNFDPRNPFFTIDAGQRILSPTWGKWDIFLPEDAEDVRFQRGYIEGAKSKRIGVMPLVHNGFDSTDTETFLHDKQLQEKVIHRMTGIALLYRLDGYNIDFENVDPKDKECLTEFVKSLSEVLHRYRKKVSVDVTVIGNPDSFWNGCYDRKALGEVADYIVLMGYDQTYEGSKYAGTVSGYEWLDVSIQEMLKEVPKEKFIMGLPLYTRVWTGNDGSVKGQTLTARYQARFLRQRNLLPVWDYKNRQYYSEWNENGVKKRLWLEEEKSLGEKLSLVEKYGLAGSAYWRYGFESDDLYGSLEDKMKAKRAIDG